MTEFNLSEKINPIGKYNTIECLLKELKVKMSIITNKIKQNGTDRLGDLNALYCALINEIDKLEAERRKDG